ncbi:MAG: hypothetical protein RLZ98_2157, partial [Pseudomonadota bacterium]
MDYDRESAQTRIMTGKGNDMTADAGTGADRPFQGAAGWLITDAKAGMDVQVRGVADALGLAAEMKHVAPTGLYKVLAPWGPVDPKERFGEAGSR